jgi:hypothetical protein
MKILRTIWALAGLWAVVGCQSQSPQADEQAVATQATVRRGQSDLACANATGTVMHRTLLPPVWYGSEVRAVYTINVAGCGKRAVYDTYPPHGLLPPYRPPYPFPAYPAPL